MVCKTRNAKRSGSKLNVRCSSTQHASTSYSSKCLLKTGLKKCTNLGIWVLFILNAVQSSAIQFIYNSSLITHPAVHLKSFVFPTLLLRLPGRLALSLIFSFVSLVFHLVFQLLHCCSRSYSWYRLLPRCGTQHWGKLNLSHSSHSKSHLKSLRLFGVIQSKLSKIKVCLACVANWLVWGLFLF